MGRPLRPTSANVVYHVLNRANTRRTLFDDDGDYAAVDLLGQTEVQNCFPHPAKPIPRTG